MKKTSLPKPITILILTLLTAVLWVGLSIYRTITVKPAAPVPESVSKPLTPTLNTSVIQKIESSLYIPDSEVPAINVGGTTAPIPTPTGTPTPVVTPEASGSASPIPQT